MNASEGYLVQQQTHLIIAALMHACMHSIRVQYAVGLVILR